MTSFGERRAGQGEAVWTPSPAEVDAAAVTAFRRWVERTRGVELSDYAALWRWSTTEVAGFWAAIWDFFGFESATPTQAVLGGAMPHARWFEGATMNYAEQVFRQASPDRPALVACTEGEPEREISWAELERQVGALAETLRGIGVQPGDRVAGYVSNRPEAVVGLLASAAVGAIWSVCAPDFGVKSARSRLAQIEATVLIAAEGYRFGGKAHERGQEVRDLANALPSVRTTILISDHPAQGPGVLAWADAVAGDAPLRYAPVPFEHPLWILFSSGTTGIPKGIVHGHGGIVLEHTKTLALTTGLVPGDRFYFFSSTSWMVWNFLVGGLLVGATPVLYDGSPTFPDIMGSWRVAAQARADVVGLGAAYISACAKAGAEPALELELSALRVVISTGSPLPTDGWHWLLEQFGARVRIDCSSGGTDVCSGIAGGSPVLPVVLGDLPGPGLGVAAAAWDPEGHPVVGAVGELVVTEPMPSMPIAFWNDPDGTRYEESYFSMYPGVWRHGDWIRMTATGSMTIEGRSDSTLNRGGVRMGSSDIYDAVDAVAGVADSLVLGIELPEGRYYMPLFVVPAPGRRLDDGLRDELTESIRRSLSKRHLPDAIVEAPAVPRTRTGKKLEVPIKRLFQGVALEAAVDPQTVDDRDAIMWFADAAARWRADTGPIPSVAGGDAR